MLGKCSSTELHLHPLLSVSFMLDLDESTTPYCFMCNYRLKNVFVVFLKASRFAILELSGSWDL